MWMWCLCSFILLWGVSIPVISSSYPSIYSRSFSLNLYDSFIDQHSFVTLHNQRELLKYYQYLLNGVDAVKSKDFSLAHFYFDQVLERYPTHADALYNKGVAYQSNGDASQALFAYNLALKYEPDDLRIRLNLAAVNQLRSNLTEAIEHYRIGLQQSIVANDSEIRMKFQINLASSLYQAGKLRESFDTSLDLLRYLRLRLAEICYSSKLLDLQSCYDHQEIFDSCLNNFLNAQRSVVYLQDQEYHLKYLLFKTLKGKISRFNTNCITPNESILQLYPGMEHASFITSEGPMLPFDSLQYEISLCLKLVIAEAQSSHILSNIPAPEHNIHLSLASATARLHIGFISHDFCDHPTAHLLEGILTIISGTWENTKKPLRITLFSYGPNDGSIYRRLLEQYADKFIELVLVSNIEAVSIIRKQNLDILLDMQLYTLGHRFEITAHQPASLQVNYLVYPGTSGAPFLQYLLADRIVTPPEHSPYYSEALILMPPPYQVSFYGRYDREEELRRIPFRFHEATTMDKPLILVNFNKLDKLDLDSFQVWSQIMSRFPNSKFWLLNPAGINETTDKNILSQESIIRQFYTRGISPKRIAFTERCGKEEHIRRHQLADLFLDSMIYGAHSTATDALKGGLPVVTLKGNSFPSRVASSLLSSFDSPERSSHLSDMLIMYSKKSYEDHVIRLLRSPSHLTQLRKRLFQLSRAYHESLSKEEDLGLFNTTQLVRDFLAAMFGIREAQNFISKYEDKKDIVDIRTPKYPHILVTRK